MQVGGHPRDRAVRADPPREQRLRQPTLAAAALFNPLRIRIQRLVDRHFNRTRYDAEATVAAFTTRLRDAVELDTVRADLLDAVKRAVQPTHASLWIKP